MINFLGKVLICRSVSIGPPRAFGRMGYILLDRRHGNNPETVCGIIEVTPRNRYVRRDPMRGWESRAHFQ